MPKDYSMKNVVFINLAPLRLKQLENILSLDFDTTIFSSAISFINDYDSNRKTFSLVVLYADINDNNILLSIQTLMPYCTQLGCPVVLLSDHFTTDGKRVAIREGISSIFELKEINNPNFIATLKQTITNPPIQLDQDGEVAMSKSKKFRYQAPWGKRFFDILVSGSVLLIFFPVYAIIALLVRLESKGPIFYISKRVGVGFQIFDFYKFRTMVPDADKKLKSLDHLNQYTKDTVNATDEFSFCDECKASNKVCEQILHDDRGLPVCEKLFLKKKKEVGGTFFKLNNDPRITKLGKFLRNSSLDEIPQLFNVLKGDMSIVGNRPLPLYEAEKLTSDMFAKRFLAPAGLTGLWQITKRGKGGPMSEEDRIKLDNVYADHYGFLFDIKIILKTIPAVFQKDNV